jgi:hypothetical protein
MRHHLTTLLLAFVAAPPAWAQSAVDSAAFVIRLGTDTLGIERYVRQGDRYEATIVTRSPRTTVRRLVLTLASDGSVARWGGGPVDREIQEQAPPVSGTIPLAGAFWLPWELVARKAQAANRDSVIVDVLAGNAVRPTTVRRVAPGRFAFLSQFDQPIEARLDARGRLTSLTVEGGTTVERLAWVDLEKLGADFAARDAAGKGLGPLSPRDTTTATAGGAQIRLEYGRPSLRGRPLDMLVAPGQVWRTGANDASTITTDRPLIFDGFTLAPGTYSTFIQADPGRWALIFNRQTGMSGLERDPARDLGRVALRTRTDAPATEQFTIEVKPEGALVFKWGRVEATAAFKTGT